MNFNTYFPDVQSGQLLSGPSGPRRVSDQYLPPLPVVDPFSLQHVSPTATAIVYGTTISAANTVIGPYSSNRISLLHLRGNGDGTLNLRIEFGDGRVAHVPCVDTQSIVSQSEFGGGYSNGYAWR